VKPENDPANVPRFDPESGGSEREYLHYINGKLLYANTMLNKLYWLLTAIGVLVATGVVVLVLIASH
jgi:hypothetical protein